jgi:translation initiation factor 3 subunit J
LQSDWEASTDEEKGKPAPVAATVPPKKKGTIKQKIAEKEAERQARLAAGDHDDEVDYDEDAVLDPRSKAQLEKQRELESDLTNATELFGSATIKGACVETNILSGIKA